MKKRILYLDVLRILAAASVVMLHVAAVYVTTPTGNKWDFIFGNILDSLSRIGVPIFLMISGVLMLDEDKTWKTRDFLKKYVKNIALILIFWSISYVVCFGVLIKLIQNESIILMDVINSIVNGSYHMWYLYMIIGIYLVTPVLRIFVKKENKNTVLYIIGILLVFVFLPTTLKAYNIAIINIFVEFFESFEIGFGFLAYYLMGWYLANFETKKSVKLSLGFLGILSTIYTIVATHLLYDGGDLFTYNNLSLNVFFSSVAVFIFVKHIFEKRNECVGLKMIEKCSTLTLGVYLVHIAVLAVIFRLVPSNIFSLARILIVWALTLICSFIFTFIVSKIPLLKKVVRG